MNALESLSYKQARLAYDQILEAVEVASNAMQQFPRLPNGLTPDEVRATVKYRESRAAFDLAMKRSRMFAKWFLKAFKKEEKARREEIHKQRIANCGKIQS